MSELKAMMAREAFDKDRWAAQLSVQQVLNILADCIPRACFREAEDRLFDAFFVNGVELFVDVEQEQ